MIEYVVGSLTQIWHSLLNNAAASCASASAYTIDLTAFAISTSHLSFSPTTLVVCYKKNTKPGWQLSASPGPPTPLAARTRTHSNVSKRSDVDRVSGLSAHAKLWLGPEMVLKGKKRAAAPGNSQKKRRKKNYMDCWDVMDVIDGNSTKGSTVSVDPVDTNSSAAERRRLFKGSSGFPSENDWGGQGSVIWWFNKYMEVQHVS